MSKKKKQKKKSKIQTNLHIFWMTRYILMRRREGAFWGYIDLKLEKLEGFSRGCIYRISNFETWITNDIAIKTIKTSAKWKKCATYDLHVSIINHCQNCQIRKRSNKVKICLLWYAYTPYFRCLALAFSKSMTFSILLTIHIT